MGFLIKTTRIFHEKSAVGAAEVILFPEAMGIEAAVQAAMGRFRRFWGFGGVIQKGPRFL